MSDLVAFLRARLDEDEAAGHAMLEAIFPLRVTVASRDDSGDTPPGCVAIEEVGGPKSFRRVWSPAGDGIGVDYGWRDHPESVEVWGPSVAARVLAEVAAKRALIDQHVRVEHEGHVWCGHCYSAPSWPCTDLRLLAQPHAEHQEFDPAWAVTT